MIVCQGKRVSGETHVHELISVTKLHQATRIDPAMCGPQGMSVNQVTSVLERQVTICRPVTSGSKCE